MKTGVGDLDIEYICDRLMEGGKYVEIADELGVTQGWLSRWIEKDANNSARVRAARIVQARFWDEQADKVISEAADHFELAKAKELAHHYRWRAAKISPHYNDKVVLAGDKESPLTTKVDLSGLTNEQLRAIASARLTNDSATDKS